MLCPPIDHNERHCSECHDPAVCTNFREVLEKEWVGEHQEAAYNGYCPAKMPVEQAVDDPDRNSAPDH